MGTHFENHDGPYVGNRLRNRSRISEADNVWIVRMDVEAPFTGSPENGLEAIPKFLEEFFDSEVPPLKRSLS